MSLTIPVQPIFLFLKSGVFWRVACGESTIVSSPDKEMPRRKLVLNRRFPYKKGRNWWPLLRLKKPNP